MRVRVRMLIAFKPPPCFMDYAWLELKLSLNYSELDLIQAAEISTTFNLLVMTKIV
jgi:hypothetical protein